MTMLGWLIVALGLSLWACGVAGFRDRAPEGVGGVPARPAAALSARWRSAGGAGRILGCGVDRRTAGVLGGGITRCKFARKRFACRRLGGGGGARASKPFTTPRPTLLSSGCWKSDQRLDFHPGSRGWCYLCEDAGMIGKGDFKRLETLIGDWRKSGKLPLDFCSNDEKRAPVNLEDLDEPDPRGYARGYVRLAASCWQRYEPVSLWKFQRCYVEMAVEKSDLRTLFENVCAEYHVPVWNAGGWSDINSRADLMKRFREHSEAGRHCVLLYCGDHDPAGLFISDVIRKNLSDLENAVGWSPDEDQLTIERFGLNYDFIEANGLLWIDGLETGSGEKLDDTKHPDHFKPYVQDYLKRYGARKVEANALVVRHEAGRQLAREAIEKYIDQDGIRRYRTQLKKYRRKVRVALPDLMRELLDEQKNEDS